MKNEKEIYGYFYLIDIFLKTVNIDVGRFAHGLLLFVTCYTVNKPF